MCRIGGQKIAIAGAQGVLLIAKTKQQNSDDDQVRLIFLVSVRAIDGSGCVRPFKDAVAFAP